MCCAAIHHLVLHSPSHFCLLRSAGEINMRDNGSLVSFETGDVTAYALESAQERGQMFVRPGDAVYEGQVVGMHAKAGDLKINVCKTKALTNMRA